MELDATVLPKPKAVLFDWDNTLVDTWPIIHQALHDTMAAYGMVPWTMEEVQERVAKSMRDAFPALFGEQWEEAGRRYQENYRKYNLAWLKPLPGSEELLEAIRTLPFFKGVVSNKRNDNLRAEAAHLGWERYFDVLVGSGDAEYDKPHCAPVLKALETSGIAPGAEVWFVGDSAIDLECAKAFPLTAIFYHPHNLPDNVYKGFPFHARVKTAHDLKNIINSSL